MREQNRTTGPDTTTHLSALEAKARRDLDEASREIDAEAVDTDETVDARAGALPHHSAPMDPPDTQESLFAEDGAYRVDENEGEGNRNADPGDVDAEADGLNILSEEELRRAGS